MKNGLISRWLMASVPSATTLPKSPQNINQATKIWFDPGTDPQKSSPLVVFLKCDGYTGNLHCLKKFVR
jgi:hypothetical protein